MKQAGLVVLSLMLLTSATCAWCAATEAAKSYELKYCVADALLSEEQGYGVGEMGLLEDASRREQSLRAEPKYASKRVYRGLVHLARGEDLKVAVVLDAASGKGPPYDRLYVDANRDGDLTNDAAIASAQATTQEGGTMTLFPPVTLPLPVESGGPYAVAITAYYVKKCPNCGATHSGAMVRSACYWEGPVRFGDQERRVVLLDGDSNGVFGESTEPALLQMNGFGSDQILLLEDAKQPATLTEALLAKATPLRRCIAVGENYYNVRPAQYGSSLEVGTEPVPCGTVRVPVREEYRLVFAAEDRQVGEVIVESTSPQPRVPVGKYRLTEHGITRKDAQGRTWVLATYPRTLFEAEEPGSTQEATPSTRGMLEVSADSVLDIPAFGPPLVLTLTAEPNRKGRAVDVSLSVAGVNGDPVSSVKVDGEAPPAPKFQIVSADGKLIAEGQFEYG